MTAPNIARFLALSFLLTFEVVAGSKITVMKNINGYTYVANDKLQRFTTMVIADGKIRAVGEARLLANYPEANTIDMEGKTLIPGLIDGHGHLIGLGFNLLNIDVRSLDSASSTVQKVAEYAKNNPGLRWIKGRGWDQEQWADGQYPTASQLDELMADRPVYLSRVDGHAAWLNSKAMEIAGIDRHTIAPPGGEIVKDSNGDPTGVLIDNAEQLVMRVMPEPTQQELQLALKKASEHLLSLGVTSMHDAGIDKATYDLYIEQAQKGKLPMRIYAMLAATDPQLREMLKAGYIQDDEGFLSIRSVKIYGDGALGSRGAALLSPYKDDPHNTGLLVTSKEALSPLFDLILDHRFQINIHAIGDRANRIALDEFARINQMPQASLFNGEVLRHRIEHAQVVHPDDIPRFKRLNVLASMQPTHATSDKSMAPKRVGEERLVGAYAWQSFLKQGTKVIAGSDFPVELANPMFGLHAAVTRQDRDNQPAGGWRTNESMTIEQTLKAFTIDAAYGAHQEQMIGGLQAGKWADFVVLDRDIFTIASDTLWQVKVLQTWVAGKKVFSQ